MRKFQQTGTLALALSATLASCTNAGVSGAGVPQVRSASVTPRLHSWMAPGAASGDLLYVSDGGYGAVFVYAYNPFGKFVGVLAEPPNPGPLCVDKQQNVWILSGAGLGSYAATEYAHGGTEPIAMVVDPAGDPTGCAVSPVNGDLAIGSEPVVGQKYGAIALFKHERGKPVVYTDQSIPSFRACCTYDHNGNLFGYGTEDSNDDTVIAELPRGSTSFTSISLDRAFEQINGMQWVGKYLTVGDTDSYTSEVVRYEITSNGAKLVGSTPLNDVSLLYQYYIDGDRIIAPNAPRDKPGGFVGIFHFPSGGSSIRMQPFSIPVAVVVSRAPH